MNLDIITLAIIESLVLLTQITVLGVQYKVTRTYHGIKYWIIGTLLMSVAVIFMPMAKNDSLLVFAGVSNPMMVLGQMFLYVGMMHFLDKKVNKKILSVIFGFFLLTYYYHMLFSDNLFVRTFILYVTLAIVTSMTACQLLFQKNRSIVETANFTAVIFLVYAGTIIFRIVLLFTTPTISTYEDQLFFLKLAFLIPTVVSNLWTFGFIIMHNQRLNSENITEKVKIEHIFNTIPDAAMILKLNEEQIVDVNEGFLLMSGYGYQEVIGKTMKTIKFWNDMGEKKVFLSELIENKICENKEAVFNCRDGSQFIGNISARMLVIYDIPHAVISIHNITERKRSEEKINELIRQLEIERNIAEKNSITDSLTGIANRRYLDNVLKTNIESLKGSNAILSLIMIDVDYFKNFNDKYGHLAGDDCLSRIAKMLSDECSGQEHCTVARYGGEEFVVILPETGEEDAKKVANRILKATEELAIPNATSDICRYVTISAGVVTVSASIIERPEQIVSMADEALYLAKENGRNRIEKKLVV